MMKKIMTLLVTGLLSSFSGLLMAHPGHGDHAVSMLSGEMHPATGIEPLLMISALVVVVYMVVGKLRR